MIGLFNFDHVFMDAFAASIETFHTINIYDPLKDLPVLDSYLINLSPKNYPNKDVVKGQIALIEKAKQDKKKLFIFDGSLSLTDKEMKWLKNSSIIFEPALLNNDRTVYLPYWLSFTLDYENGKRNRPYDFTCNGDLETDLANKLFFDSAKYLNLKFAVESKFIKSSYIENKCYECDIDIVESAESNMVILLPSKNQISTGYFPNTQVYINSNTGILFPGDMIYYRFMPQVWNKEDVSYYYKKTMINAYILHYKTEIEQFYPRMLLKNVIKKIKEYL